MLREEKSKFCHRKLVKSQFAWVLEAFWQAERDWDPWLLTLWLNLISAPLSEIRLRTARHWEGMGERLGYRAPRHLSIGNATLQQGILYRCCQPGPRLVIFLGCLLSIL